MATQTPPTYPPQNNAEAIELNIWNSNQFHAVINGDIVTTIPTYEGNGEIPSVSKAIYDSAAYKTPIPWVQGEVQTDLVQPREFNNYVYVPISSPQTLGAQPTDAGWKLYLQSIDESSIDQGFNYYREVVAIASKSVFTLPFTYETQTIGGNEVANMFVTVDGVDLDLVDGVSYTDVDEITLTTPVTLGQTVQIRLETIATFSIVSGLKDAAEASATNAAVSETNAATSETNAATSASEAAATAAEVELFKEELLDIKPCIKDTPNNGWGWTWGGEFSRAAYPEAWTAVQASSRFITEAQWQAKSAATEGGIGAVPYFSDGDGSTTFRVLRLVDFHRGSLTATPQDSVSDTIKSHFSEALSVTFTGTSTAASNMALDNSDCDGIIGGSSTLAGHYVANSGQDNIPFIRYVGASETAPKHWFAPWQIKLAGGIVNDGTIDASALQTQINTINGTTIPNAVAPKFGTDNLLHITDEKPSGVGGGTFTQNVWINRDLNTPNHNTITGATINVNSVNLQAGEYYAEFSTIAYFVDVHRCRLRNLTADVTLLQGLNGDTSPSAGISSTTTGSGVFTLTSAADVGIQHFTNGVTQSTGLGIPLNSGENEVYTSLKIWRTA